jgi:hypothetical protein
MSVPEIAYHKVAGALAGTLPLLVGVPLGFLFNPNSAGDLMAEMNREPTEIGVMIVAVLQFILFLHVTAFLSLVIKRGALPLAIAIQYLGGMLFFGFAAILFSGFSGGIGGVLFLTGFVCVVLTIPLHLAIGYRLERAAAQE